MNSRGLQFAILLLIVATLAPGALAEEILVVGLSIQHREVDTVEAVKENGVYYLPLEPLARATGCTIEVFGSQVHVATPLGTVFFYEQDLRRWNGVLYVSQDLVERRLHTPVTFEQAEFALDLDLPWRPAWGEPRPEVAEVVPDAEPSSFGLSDFREDYNFTRTERYSRHNSSTLLDGRVAGGTWRTRYETNFNGYQELREYNWQRIFGQNVFQAGQQWVQLHPLLDSMRFSGAQLGWTNQALERYDGFGDSRTLFSRNASPVRTLRGRAEPGAFVQLRVDGVVVSQTVVGLSGEFEFIEVRLPSLNLNYIEIYIFDHHNLSVPVEVRELRIATSDQMLPVGGATHVGGAGVGGNLSNGVFQPERYFEEGAAAFYQWRQGVHQNLTMEAAVQSVDGQVQGQGGMVASLFNRFVMTLAGAVSNGESGYLFSLDGGNEQWQVTARSVHMPMGFNGASRTSEYFEHGFDVNRRLGDDLNVGLRARYHQLHTERARFILPYVSWRPMPRMSLNLRPDYDGRYRFDGYWSMTGKSRISCIIHETAILDLTHRFNQRYGLSLTTEVGDEDQVRHSAVFSRTGDWLTEPSFHVGPVWNSGDLGFVAGGSMRVLPGVFASAEYQSEPPIAMSEHIDDSYLVASVRTDFTFSGGRMFAAEGGTTMRNRGAVAGRILVKGLEPGQEFDLEGVVVIIDNLHKVLTDASGNFYKGDLKEGTHVVDLDLENLPMALAPVRSSLIARVVPRAVTRVDFTVRQEYGLAGRVTDAAGGRMPGVRVELTSPSGSLISVVTTDQFGLYRIDHVAPGEYRLRINAAEPALGPNRSPECEIVVRDEFLFDLDLQIPATILAAR